MSPLFDTHCHLNSKRLNPNLDDIISQSHKNKVKYFLIPGLDYKTSVLAQGISSNYLNVYAACGLHPEYVAEDYQNQIEQISEI